jgi:hypothetical protein
MGVVQTKDPTEKFLEERGRKIVVGALEEEADLIESFLFRQRSPGTGWRGFHRIVHLNKTRGSR